MRSSCVMSAKWHVVNLRPKKIVVLAATILMCLGTSEGKAIDDPARTHVPPMPDVIEAPVVQPAGATSRQTPPSSTPQPDQHDRASTHNSANSTAPVHIAVALPLTGPRHMTAAAAKQRLTQLLETINESGGILGRPLRLDIHDDGCSREGAQKLATHFTADATQPAVIIGHPCPAAAITAAPLYQKAGILFIATGARHPDLTRLRPGPLVFRAAGRDDLQGADAGKRLSMLARDSSRALIIHDRTTMARTMAIAAGDALKSVDVGTVPTTLTIVAGKNDYSPTIDKIQAAGPTAILFLGFPAEATILLRQLRQRGMTQPVLFNDAMAGSTFLNQAGDLLNETVEIMMPVSIATAPAQEPELPSQRIASDAQAALMAWRSAANAVVGLDGQRIAEHLQQAKGPQEEIRFDASGDAITASYAPFRRIDNIWRRVDLN